MKATEILMAEHRVIESVLDALESAVQVLNSGVDVPADIFLDASDFIRSYADDAHHRKEEGVLFKAMARCGFPEDRGPVAVMLAEHGQARELTRQLEEAARRLQAGERAARKAVAGSALPYVGLLRNHIQKEDQVLYVMAARSIPADEQEQMLVDFERVERDEIGAGVHEKYEALARDLGARARALG